MEAEVNSLKGSGGKGGTLGNSEQIQTSTSIAYTGVSIEVPANSYVCLTARAIYGSSVPKIIAIGNSNSNLNIVL